ncbi:MAG TPA: hypothetical protein DEB40_13115 [Elusimicrobia bacterium]|nr:hypothetical protein [Elusimicrobiota bacterium]HBT62675.1 hypothetical protein [Elusimicrobiota bacterium]
MINMKEGGKTAVNFMIGTAIGGAIGFVLGILFAPNAGKETREQLGTWLKRKREKSAELLARINAEAKRKKEQVEAALQEGRHAYEESSHR